MRKTMFTAAALTAVAAGLAAPAHAGTQTETQWVQARTQALGHAAAQALAQSYASGDSSRKAFDYAHADTLWEYANSAAFAGKPYAFQVHWDKPNYSRMSVSMRPTYGKGARACISVNVTAAKKGLPKTGRVQPGKVSVKGGRCG